MFQVLNLRIGKLKMANAISAMELLESLLSRAHVCLRHGAVEE